VCVERERERERERETLAAMVSSPLSSWVDDENFNTRSEMGAVPTLRYSVPPQNAGLYRIYGSAFLLGTHPSDANGTGKRKVVEIPCAATDPFSRAEATKALCCCYDCRARHEVGHQRILPPVVETAGRVWKVETHPLLLFSLSLSLSLSRRCLSVAERFLGCRLREIRTALDAIAFSPFGMK
jgi:hypothetical protein